MRVCESSANDGDRDHFGRHSFLSAYLEESSANHLREVFNEKFFLNLDLNFLPLLFREAIEVGDLLGDLVQLKNNVVAAVEHV